MQSVETFLAYAIQLEREAALRYGQLADAMQSCSNREVERLFRRLADYSRLHLADAMTRAGFREIPEIGAELFNWPDLESPETAAIWGADPFIGCAQALEIALEAEQAGFAYYNEIFQSTDDPEIRVLAAEFAAEEHEHVSELKKWIAARNAGAPFPVSP